MQRCRKKKWIKFIFVYLEFVWSSNVRVMGRSTFWSSSVMAKNGSLKTRLWNVAWIGLSPSLPSARQSTWRYSFFLSCIVQMLFAQRCQIIAFFSVQIVPPRWPNHERTYRSRTSYHWVFGRFLRRRICLGYVWRLKEGTFGSASLETWSSCQRWPSV